MSVATNKPVLVVGAGFAGATIALELARQGFRVNVVDCRPHIGGNAFTDIDSTTGAKYHVYGPHIFHTNDKAIVRWLDEFTDWLPYQHKVKAQVDGVGDVPLPINLDTINLVFGKRFESEHEVVQFLQEKRVACPEPANAWEHLLSVYGESLSKLFFEVYTQKMWGLSLKELPASVVARLPVRFDQNPHYFNDSFQMMPKAGYTVIFERMLDHPNISVSLSTPFCSGDEKGYHHTFNSMPIDVFFDCKFGELPYRSIRFEHRVERFDHEVPTLNFTDSGPYTRKTCWDLYPGCGGGSGQLVTYEQPCDYRDNHLERYYPVKTSDGWPQRRYRQYRELAKSVTNVTFIGRCGQYIYYDMHQVIANSLKIARDFLSRHKA
jgi:UDP-galactopyranose mutase